MHYQLELKKITIKSSISANYPKSNFGRICSGVRPPHTVEHSLELLATLMDLAKPGAEIIIHQVVSDEDAMQSTSNIRLSTLSDIKKNLKLAGFVNIENSTKTSTTDDTNNDIEQKFKLSKNERYKVVEIKCQTPNFYSGSSQPLSSAKKIQEKKNQSTDRLHKSPIASAAEKNAIWSLDNLDDEDDFLDPDTLIDDEDLKKPDFSSLRGINPEAIIYF